MPKWYGGSALNPDETVNPENQWMEQFFRLTRWRERVTSLKDKIENEQLNAFDLDALIAYREQHTITNASRNCMIFQELRGTFMGEVNRK